MQRIYKLHKGDLILQWFGDNFPLCGLLEKAEKKVLCLTVGTDYMN